MCQLYERGFVSSTYTGTAGPGGAGLDWFRVSCLSVSRLGRLQHGVAFGLEFCPRLPFGHHVAVCHAITYEKVKLSVLNGAAHIPIGLNLVGRLVVVLGCVFLPHLQAPALGSAYKIDSRIRVKRGHPLLGKAEMIGAVEVPLLG